MNRFLLFTFALIGMLIFFNNQVQAGDTNGDEDFPTGEPKTKDVPCGNDLQEKFNNYKRQFDGLLGKMQNKLKEQQERFKLRNNNPNEGENGNAFRNFFKGLF